MLFADLLPLFAQGPAGFRGGNPPNPQGPPPEAVGAIIATYLGCIGFAILLSYGIRILFCLTLSKCLKAIAPRNRTTEPGSVWLALIPLAGIVFMIINMFRVPESVSNEYRSRGWREDGDFGKTLAIMYLIGAFVFGPLALVVFIMYWVKISGYTKEFLSRPSRREYDDDDDDDDRPRRRSSRRDEADDEDEDDRPRRRRRDED